MLYFFLASGLLSLAYAGFLFADLQTYQALERQKFKQAILLPEPQVFAEGDLIGEVQVPRLELSSMVLQGDSKANLRRAVAHIAKSALPGERGNVALAGHRDTVFRSLRNIRVGDKIRFRTSAQSFEYVVVSIEIVPPNDIKVLEPTAGHDLTLLTCYPFYYAGPAPKRFVVHAREIEAALPEALTGRVEVHMHSDRPLFH